jgi:hypothetical protein
MGARYDANLAQDQVVATVLLKGVGPNTFAETRDWTYVNGAGSYKTRRFIDGLTGEGTMKFEFSDADTAFWFKVRFQ